MGLYHVPKCEAYDHYHLKRIVVVDKKNTDQRDGAFVLTKNTKGKYCESIAFK